MRVRQSTLVVEGVEFLCHRQWRSLLSPPRAQASAVPITPSELLFHPPSLIICEVATDVTSSDAEALQPAKLHSSFSTAENGRGPGRRVHQ